MKPRKLGETAEGTLQTCVAPGTPLKHLEDVRSAVALQCRYSIMSASMNSIAASVPAPLLAALVAQQLWSAEGGLAYAVRIPDQDLRAEALAALTPHLSEPLLREALAATDRREPSRNWLLAWRNLDILEKPSCCSRGARVEQANICTRLRH